MGGHSASSSGKRPSHSILVHNEFGADRRAQAPGVLGSDVLAWRDAVKTSATATSNMSWSNSGSPLGRAVRLPRSGAMTPIAEFQLDDDEPNQ